MTENMPAPIGHNNPPSDLELLKERLSTDNVLLLDHAKALVEACDRVPEIADAESAAKVTDFIKQINGAKKKLDERRVAEKEPFLVMGRMVDIFFKPQVDALDVAKAKPTRILGAWMDKVAAAERTRREAEAQRLREEADQRAKDAAALESADMGKEANKAMNTAIRTEAKAERFEKSVASGSGLAVSRGEQATSSQRKRWVVEIVDVSALDLEALRSHLPPAALQQAVNSFMSAGGRELKGARIYEKTETVVR